MALRRSAKLLVFIFGVSFVLGALVLRLYDLQVVRGGVYRAQADDNRFFTERVTSNRGSLFDRYNQPLVVNLPEYYLITNDKALYSQHEHLEYQEALAHMATESASVGYSLRRKYLYPEVFAHTLGYVGAVSAEDLQSRGNLHPTDMVGKLGLEKTLDDKLRGQAGSKIYEINALGEKQRLVGEKPQVAGLDIKTTLDPYLSQVAYEAMAEQRGAVVIMDADTGDILSLISKPSFDANLMTSHYVDEQSERTRLKAVQEMIKNPLQLFFNRAIGGSYPPGSVFKPITAIAGLDSQALNAGTEVVDKGVLEVGEYSFSNWYYTQYGRVEGAISLERALARSNDIYFYKAAEWIGPTKLADTARAFGLGRRTGVTLSGEASGVVPDPAWKEKTLGEPWYLGNTFHFGIGQDNLLVTPIQMASMTQAFAKQGNLCKPRITELDAIECSSLSYQTQDIDLVLQGMLGACSSGGTAFPLFEHNRQYLRDDLDPEENIDRGAVACKTGTAEFGATDAKGYKKTHGWFIAIVGVDRQVLLGEDSQLSEQSDEVVKQESSTETTASELSASESALLNSSQQDLKTSDPRSEWLSLIRQNNFPKRLAIAVLVESDEEQPYKEGSREVAPIVEKIVSWIYQR